MTTTHRPAPFRRLASGAPLLLIAAALVTPAAARADDPAPPAPETAVPSTADASGVAVSDEPAASPARALLVVPRTAAVVVAAPLHGGLRLYEEHHVRERFIDLFFDDSRTFGLYPVVALETGLSPQVGARLVHRRPMGAGSSLRLAGDYGGEARFRLDGGAVGPGLAGGLLRLRASGGWMRQPSVPFFGIGDEALSHPDDSVIGLPARGGFAVSTHFRQEVVHGVAALEIDARGPVFASVSSGYFQRIFDEGARASASGDPAGTDPGRTDVRFDPATLTGWGDGTRVVYSEAQLGWDTLATTSPFVPVGTPSTGTHLVGFAGLARGVGGARARYARFGGDALRYFDLYNGDRVLILRGRVEGVVGDDADIPFTDLPRLGGPQLLRGYARERFRDRVAMLASVEYRYPVWRQLAGFVFVDAGRVMPQWSDLGSAVTQPRQLHASGGMGLEVLSGDRFQLRGQAAGSPEGFFLQVALQPVYRLPTHNYRM